MFVFRGIVMFGLVVLKILRALAMAGLWGGAGTIVWFSASNNLTDWHVVIPFAVIGVSIGILFEARAPKKERKTVLHLEVADSAGKDVAPQLRGAVETVERLTTLTPQTAQEKQKKKESPPPPPTSGADTEPSKGAE